MNTNHYTDAYQLKNYKQSFNDSYDNANINLNNTNYDMETVEKMILSIFKNTNSELLSSLKEICDSNNVTCHPKLRFFVGHREGDFSCIA